MSDETRMGRRNPMACNHITDDKEKVMKDITFMPNDYIVTHIKTDTICEHFSNDDVVYVVEERIVPLVRCKECRHKDDCEQEVLLSDMYGEVEDTAHITYCSYGEREGE